MTLYRIETVNKDVFELISNDSYSQTLNVLEESKTVHIYKVYRYGVQLTPQLHFSKWVNHFSWERPASNG